MARLAETTVQKQAVQFLERRYKWWARDWRVFADLEMRTRPEHGSKRADGLLAYQHWLWGLTVVSLEAKSQKTLPAIRPYRNPWRWLTNSLLAGLLICLTSGAFLAYYRFEEIEWQYYYPIGAFLLGSILYAYFTRNHFGHYDLRVIDQVQQYPGHRQWLAISADSARAMGPKKFEILRAVCKVQGVGLIEVATLGRVRVRVRPRRRWTFHTNLLAPYSRAEEVLAFLRPSAA